MDGPKTPITNTASYLPVAEFLKRADARVVAQLCSDTGKPVAISDLASDPNLAAALLSASGMFEAAVFQGERYSMLDFQALPNPSASLSLLYTLLTNVTMTLLFERRPEATKDSAVMLRAEAWLKALANGEKIFSFKETADAGLLKADRETPYDVARRDGVTYITRFGFGRRANRWRCPE